MNTDSSIEDTTKIQFPIGTELAFKEELNEY
jgi:hypothetical protein